MYFWEERIEELLRQLKGLCTFDAFSLKEWEITPEADSGEESGNRGERVFGGTETLSAPDEVWYRRTVAVPKAAEHESIEFFLEIGGAWEEENPQFEFFVNEELVQGIDRNHRQVLLDPWTGEKAQLALRGYGEPLAEGTQIRPGIRRLERRIEAYYYDVYVPFSVMTLLEKEETNYAVLMECINGSLKLLDLRKPYSRDFYASLRRAHAFLKNELYGQHCGRFTESVCCVGQTHIDVAWLWTLGVTRKKAVRSFSTVIRLMEQYPEYIFMCSQPQLYAFVKEEAPRLYEKIQARVKEGRWEAEGGMFVEADCNLTGGESLVRQFLVGKKFFREEFGKDCRILWLPDVFGYSAALPQIMKECGIRYFMTTKISWNDTNKMPYDTFYWKGIDGARILTHFITTRDYASSTRKKVTNDQFTTGFSTNYNGDLVPSQIKGGWQRYQQKNLNREVLNSFGYGDGGGGPTREMLEIQQRLGRAIPGCPRTRIATAGDFFRKLEAALSGNVPVWSGELYLEYHRATYTSVGKNKRLNRYSESLVQNLEMLGIYGGSYPKELLDRAWEVVLRNQFHDILPGSSIHEVYEDSWKEYEGMIGAVEEEMEHALARVKRRYRMREGSLAVYNFNGTPGRGLVCVDAGAWEGAAEAVRALPHQRTGDGAGILLPVGDIPAKGFVNYFTSFPAGMEAEREKMLCFSGECVENAYYRLTFNEKGQFASFYDKRAGRELLKPGVRGNVLMTYEDKPFQYDNWNLEHYYTEKSWEIDDLREMELVEQGPLRYGIRFSYRYLDSKITETLYFYPDHSRIDLDFHLDWREDQIFLKLLFGLELNTSEAAYEIQYGNVTRSTARNTSWDCARFEVCYQKWMDLSEAGYGVSFFNNGKYGVSVEENVVGLSLLKCGTYPDPKADRGEHKFSLAMYPHPGGWREAGTVAEAYQFNNPLRAVICGGEEPAGVSAEAVPLLRTDAGNIVIEAMKLAEQGDGIIVRLYECENRYGKVVCRLHPDITAAEECNMLEETKAQLLVQEGTLEFIMKPYEIKTLKLLGSMIK